MAQLRLLACFAHPDDEAFTASGVLAASTARGVQVRLVCATCGEEGDIRQPGVATRATLGQVRHEELRRSCAVLGLQEPVMLGYRDSGWGDAPAQYHPHAFVQAPPWQVVQRLVEEIRRFKPHIVLTFEPDGISGHKDFLAIFYHYRFWIKECGMDDIRRSKRCSGSSGGCRRTRVAAVEAAKLGHGGSSVRGLGVRSHHSSRPPIGGGRGFGGGAHPQRGWTPAAHRRTADPRANLRHLLQEFTAGVRCVQAYCGRTCRCGSCRDGC